MNFAQFVPSFNAGEISPYLEARSDIEKYNSGCRTLENFIILPYGGVYRRPGLEYCCTANITNIPIRLIGFNFSVDQSFIIEMGAGYMRFIDRLTKQPVENGSGILIVSNPYNSSELRDLQYVQINDIVYVVHPMHPPYKLSRIANNNWTFAEVEWDWPTVMDDNIGSITIEPSATDGDGITLTATAPAWVTATVYKAKDFVSDGAGDGRIYQAQSKYTSGATLADDVTAGNLVLYEVFTLQNVGGYFQLAHERPTNFVERKINADASSGNLIVLGAWTITTYGTWNATVHVERSYNNGTNWEIIRTYDSNSDANFNGAGEETKQCLLRIRVENYASNTGARANLTATEAKVFGFAKVTAYTSSLVVTADVIRDFYAADATPFWAEGAWSDRRGFPRTVALQDDRIFYGGNQFKPLTVWGSVLDDFENFRLYSNDDAGLAFTLSSPEANSIQWLISKDQLLIGTAGDEWTLGGSDVNTTITPTNVKAVRQSSYGSKYMRALAVNDVILFVQRQGRKVREMVYSFDTQNYKAPDLTVLAEHITKGEILEVAFQQQPDAIYWCVTGLGELVGMTYERDQNVVGWHRQITDGFVESVATVYGGSGSDEVWISVRRTVNGAETRYIERFKPDYRTAYEAADKDNWWYLDSAKQFTFDNPTTEITGLGHLEGCTVGALGDGAVEPNKVVTGGAITLQNAASTVLVGMPYTSNLQPMFFEMQTQQGSTVGSKKRIPTAYIYTRLSLGGEYAANGGPWCKLFSRDMHGPMDSSPDVRSGPQEADVASNSARTSSLMVRQTQPLPLTILAINTEWDVAGT